MRNFTNEPSSKGLQSKQLNVSEKFYSTRKASESSASPLAVPKYLTFKDRLTQIWINQYTIVLALIIVKVFLFSSSLKASLDKVAEYAVSSCEILNSYATTVANVPVYVANSSNSLVAKSAQEANNAAVQALQLILEALEQVFVFYLELMIGTYACLLTTAIDSSVDIASNATETVVHFVNQTLVEATDSIENGLGSLSSLLNKAENLGEDLASLFTGTDHSDLFKRVNLTVSSLKNLKIPIGINTKLESLAQKTPSFSDVENKTKELIHIPFNVTKRAILKEFDGNVNVGQLKVPSVQNTSVCPNSSVILQRFALVSHEIDQTLRVIVILIAIFCVAFLAITSLLDWHEWKKIRLMVEDIYDVSEENLSGKEQFDSKVLEVIFKYRSTIWYHCDGFFKQKLPEISRTIVWLTNYVCSESSLLVLKMSICGLITCLLQLILIHSVSKNIVSLANQFSSEKFLLNVTKTMKSASQEWSHDTNKYLEMQEASINERVLSHISNVTSSINVTISSFYSTMNLELTHLFNNTLFEKPVKSVIYCVIGGKLENLQKGLVWVHNHSNLSLPRVNDTYFFLESQMRSNDVLKTPLTSKSQIIVNKVLLSAYYSVKIEFYISLVLLSVFFLQIPIACLLLFLKHKLGKKELFRMQNCSVFQWKQSR